MESPSCNLIQRLSRKKFIPADKVCATHLKRCLTTLDLTALGIGSTLGLGIYVLAGKVAKEQAGPSVTLSFFIAAVASVFAGLCYAEFGARVPRTGSAYVYSYVAVGELLAFIIGWNLVMEYVIGTASVAKGYSNYLDFLVDKKMSHSLNDTTPIHVTGLAPYPDFLACGITLLLTVVLAIGVKESSRFNNIFTLLNLMVVAYVVICGAFKADFHNWDLSKDEVMDSGISDPEKYGNGGFFPYGFAGTLAGAATCFYGFVGFDCIATTGEEVKNPQKAIPISIVLSLLFIFLAYFGISMITTLMVPYYLQDVDAPLPHVFQRVGWPVAKWIVSIGALAGLSTSLLGAMFPLPRILYAMSSDGLIFRFLSVIHPRFQTPVTTTIISGCITAIMALFLSLDELIEMMSIGTLMAYTLVAACVLLLRYRQMFYEDYHYAYAPLPREADYLQYQTSDSADEELEEPRCGSTDNLGPDETANRTTYSFREIAYQYFNCNKVTSPSYLSSQIVNWNVRLIFLATIWLACNVSFLGTQIADGTAWAIFLLIVSIVCVVFVFISIACQPQNPEVLSFKVPWVPFIPWLSLFINVYLMLQLKWMTWVRFAVWLFLGLLIYIFYGLRESSEEYRQKGLPIPSTNDSSNERTSIEEGSKAGTLRTANK